MILDGKEFAGVRYADAVDLLSVNHRIVAHLEPTFVHWMFQNRQQVFSSNHTQAILGKKTLDKGVKGEDCGEIARRLVGDGLSLNEEMLVLKMPVAQLKGSSAYHSKEHKSKGHKDRKGRERSQG